MRKQGDGTVDSMKRMNYLYSALYVALLAAAVYSKAIFPIACAACATLFLPAQLLLLSSFTKTITGQKKICRYVGWFILLPSAGLIAGSVRVFFFNELPSTVEISYILTALSAALVALLLLQMIMIRKDRSVAARFIRYAHFAALSAPASLAIGLSINLSETENASDLIGITGTVFGVFALLVAITLILVSQYGFKSTAESLRALSGAIKAKKLVFTRITLLKDAFLVIGKSIIGIFFASVFMLTNAFYSLGMGGARLLAIKMHSQKTEDQLRSFRWIGIIILVSSLCYALYALRMFLGGPSMKFSMSVALVIACYTFVEFALNIRDSIRLRRSNQPAAEALKLIDLASTLICFVLTQTAIMSFSSKDDPSFANGLSGIIFGTVAALVGVYMIVRSYFLKKKIADTLRDEK